MPPKLTGSGLDDCPLGGSREYVTVGPYAWCDYITDGVADEVQINAAIDAVSASGTGGDVVLAAANFQFSDSNGYITVDPRVRLLGVGVPHVGLAWASSTFDHDKVQCSRIIIHGDTTNPAVKLDVGSSIENIQFFYHDQPNSGSPVTYPATIKTIGSTDMYIKNCAFPNSYIAIEHTGSGRCNIYDCSGYPIYKGVILAANQERSVIERNYWTPNAYCGDPASTLTAWIYANGYGYYISRADGTLIKDNLVLGYKYSVYINKGAEAECYGIEIRNNWLESSMYPVHATGCAGLIISDNVLQAGGLFGSSANDVAVTLSNCFKYRLSNNIVDSSADGFLIDSGCGYGKCDNNIIGFGYGDHGTTTKYGIKCEGGSVNGNQVFASVSSAPAYTVGIAMYGGVKTCNNNTLWYCNPSGILLTALSSGCAIGNTLYTAPLTDSSSGGWITGNTLNKIY